MTFCGSRFSPSQPSREHNVFLSVKRGSKLQVCVGKSSFQKGPKREKCVRLHYKTICVLNSSMLLFPSFISKLHSKKYLSGRKLWKQRFCVAKHTNAHLKLTLLLSHGSRWAILQNAIFSFPSFLLLLGLEDRYLGSQSQNESRGPGQLHPLKDE